MKKIIIFTIFGLLFLTATEASAAEVVYQRVTDIRGDKAIAKMYGTLKEPEFYTCDLVNWTCMDSGTSTPKLFSEFPEIEYALSPDKSLALVVDNTQTAPVYKLYDVKANPAVVLKTLDYSQNSKRAVFSQDNSKILFVNSANNFTTFDIQGNKIANTVKSGENYSFLTFSPKGNFIAFYQYSTQTNPNREYFLIDVQKNKTYSWKEKNDYWDLLAEEEKIFEFSPDEKYFFFLSDRGGHQNIYSVRLNKLAGVSTKDTLGRRLIEGRFIVSSLMAVEDSSLYFLANKEQPLKWNLYNYNLQTGKLKVVAENVASWPGISKIQNQLVFYKIGEDPLRAQFLDLKSKNIKGLPISIDNEIKIAQGKPMSTGKTFGVLYKPDNFDAKTKYPLLIWLHGGPYRQTSSGYHPYYSYGAYDYILERLRQSGVMIYKFDYPGSYGYSDAYAQSIKKNVGKIDVQAVIDVANYFKNNYKIEDISLMGNSYGGYLALRTMAEKPKIFDNSISINGVADWWTLLNNVPDSIFTTQFAGAPSKANKKLYDKASIFLSINNLVNKKVSLIYGDEDSTIPNAQSTMLYDALLTQNSNTASILSISGETHVIEKKENLDKIFDTVSAQIK